MNTANIKQIITAFHNVVSICENQQWVKTVTSEDIKVAFKLGCFVEKTMFKFSEQNCTSQFLNSVRLWGEQNNKTMNYDAGFYSQVCDHLLLKFFKHQSLNESVIDVAVRMYTSLFPKERLQVVLKDLILTSAAFDSIFDFTVANKPSFCVSDLKHELILQEWCKDFDCGNTEKITSLVTESLTSFKVGTSLPPLLGVLALSTKNSVTELILHKLLEKMFDRSILSKNFWLALLRNVEYGCLCAVCVNYKDFLESFCNFLIYVGGMMELDSNQWVSNANISVCPEIAYSELEAIFVCLCQYESSVKDYVLNRLNEAQENTDLLIWEHIKHKCL